MIYKAVEDAEDRQEQGVPNITAAQVGILPQRVCMRQSSLRMAMEVP